MYVNGPNRTNKVQVGGAGRRRGSGSSGFAPASQPEAAAAPTTAGPQTIQGVESILALQSVDDATSERKRVVQQGNAMLDVLEDMRLDLISGHVSDEKLDRLAMMLSGRKSSSDSKLDAVIAEIELRVRVELAKRNRYPVAV